MQSELPVGRRLGLDVATEMSGADGFGEMATQRRVRTAHVDDSCPYASGHSYPRALAMRRGVSRATSQSRGGGELRR